MFHTVGEKWNPPKLFNILFLQSKDKFAVEMEEIRKQLENTQIKLSASEVSPVC